MYCLHHPTPLLSCQNDLYFLLTGSEGNIQLLLNQPSKTLGKWTSEFTSWNTSYSVAGPYKILHYILFSVIFFLFSNRVIRWIRLDVMQRRMIVSALCKQKGFSSKVLGNTFKKNSKVKRERKEGKMHTKKKLILGQTTSVVHKTFVVFWLFVNVSYVKLVQRFSLDGLQEPWNVF